MLNISQIKKIAVVQKQGRKGNSIYNKLVVYKDGDPKNARTIELWILWLKQNSKSRKHFVPSEIFKCASGYFKKIYRAKWNFLYMEDIEEFNIHHSEFAKLAFLKLKHNNKALVAYNLMGYPVAGFENVFNAMRWLKSEGVKGADFRSIIDCARDYNKKVKTHKHFVWRFLEDIKDR